MIYILDYDYFFYKKKNEYTNIVNSTNYNNLLLIKKVLTHLCPPVFLPSIL